MRNRLRCHRSGGGDRLRAPALACRSAARSSPTRANRIQQVPTAVRELRERLEAAAYRILAADQQRQRRALQRPKRVRAAPVNDELPKTLRLSDLKQALARKEAGK